MGVVEKVVENVENSLWKNLGHNKPVYNLCQLLFPQPIVFYGKQEGEICKIFAGGT